MRYPQPYSHILRQAPPMHPSHGSRSELTPEPRGVRASRTPRALAWGVTEQTQEAAAKVAGDTSKVSVRSGPENTGKVAPKGLPRLPSRCASADGVPWARASQHVPDLPYVARCLGHLLSCGHWGAFSHLRWDPTGVWPLHLQQGAMVGLPGSDLSVLGSSRP